MNRLRQISIGSYLSKSTATGLANTVISGIFGVTFVPLIISRIGMRGYGIWAVLFIFVNLASLADFGFSKSLVYFTAGKELAAETLETQSAIFILNAATALFALAAVTAVWVFEIDPWQGSDIPFEMRECVLLSGGVILASAVAASFFRSCLEAQYRLDLVNILSCLLSLLMYGGVYLITLIYEDMRLIVLYTAGVHVFILIVTSLFYGWKKISLLRIPETAVFRHIFRYSWRMYVGGLFVSIIIPSNRYLLLMIGGNISNYGVFDASLKVALPAFALMTAFSRPLFALFSDLKSDGADKIAPLLRNYFYGMVGLYVAGICSFLLIGNPLIRLVFVEQADGIYHTSMILIIGLGASGIGEPFVRAVWSFGDLSNALKIRISQLLVNVMVFYLLSSL